jgi:hypothetical protein
VTPTGPAVTPFLTTGHSGITHNRCEPGFDDHRWAQRRPGATPFAAAGRRHPQLTPTLERRDGPGRAPVRPFGDIAAARGREDQFRNAFLSRCVGAWSLHPAQIDIARRELFRSFEETRWARRVIERMGDRTGAVMVEGTLPDDASVKQCQVVANLAHQLAERDPDFAKLSATGYTTP